MTKRFSAESVLAGLTSFQRSTVAHVMERLYAPSGTRRFLVADETGLGKSLVARGVIAHTIERLQDEPSIQRIDIIYVCSNRDLARQNLARLDVVGGSQLPVADRLTMLAAHSHRFEDAPPVGTKPVNLVSFTPGTSFGMGWTTGQRRERALIYLLLEEALALKGWQVGAAQRLLQGTVRSLERFRRDAVDGLRRELAGGLDPTIARAFTESARRLGLLARFAELVDGLGRRRRLLDHEAAAASQLIRDLRATLATASVAALEPDLVILDEFQRFRHLLDPGQPAGELAHTLFEHGEARVLLLSATPYKPFTFAEERADAEDHYADLFETLRFLTDGSRVDLQEVRRDLGTYRELAMAGDDTSTIASAISQRLTQVMCRTERPSAGEVDMLAEVADAAAEVRADDLLGYAVLHAVAARVDARLHVDYWKSVPYFVNFLERYQIGGKVRAALKDPGRRGDLTPLLRHAQQLGRAAIEAFEPIDLGSARLRALAVDLLDRGAWKLLWLPPSLPYHAPSGPFASPDVDGLTKRLIFSSWLATPTAVASLLSYEAERRIAEGSTWTQNTPAGREGVATRLDYRLRDGQPASMTTLALFFPNPALASATDPLDIARQRPDERLDPAAVGNFAVPAVAEMLAGLGQPTDASVEQLYALLPLAVSDALPGLDIDRMAHALAGAPEGEHGDRALRAHVEMAVNAVTAGRRSGNPPSSNVAEVVARLGLHGPGNVAYRALDRLVEPGSAITRDAHWSAAAVVASAIRSLFNRPESIVLLDQLALEPDQPYWRNVLAYCEAGNLQAVLDEYLHHLAASEKRPTNDDELWRLAVRARDAIALRPSNYEAFDWRRPDKPITMTSRFALRYGSQKSADDTERPAEIRNAFNSPFWPFVLATTSVGQEGIDFHWWCHAVVHWNTPANPVDFEQREGRVHRYAGHAIRKNIAARHRTGILSAARSNPWDTGYALATEYCVQYGDLSPHWVYPGPAKIERHALPLPLSKDLARIRRIREDVVLYRLAFGQPRQEDLLELLRRRGANGKVTPLDLRPPR